MPRGPKFIRFFWPIIEALRELGGSARARDVVDLVIERTGIPDDERAERLRGGALRVENQVHWARNYLVWAGLLDRSQHGYWQLTTEGWSFPLDEQGPDAAYELFKRIRQERSPEWGHADPDDGAEDPEQPPEPIDTAELEDTTLVTSVRSAVLALTSNGFENLCRRLLNDLGLAGLRVVGQASDRGIDVEGHLRVNAVVSFRVGVQCKRYADGNRVTPSQIREFQGALGPFDRGIFITTSVFTQEAEEQAARPGYKPIDLIDGERLVELLIERGLGVKTVTVVDSEFFAPFQ